MKRGKRFMRRISSAIFTIGLILTVVAVSLGGRIGSEAGIPPLPSIPPIPGISPLEMYSPGFIPGTVSEIKSLSVEVEAGRVNILSGGEDEFYVELKNVSADAFSWELKDGTLSIKNKLIAVRLQPDKGWLSTILDNLRKLAGNFQDEGPVISVYVPEGFKLKNLNISLIAGRCMVDDVSAESSKINVNAGELLIVELYSDRAALDVSAGQCTIDKLSAQDVSTRVGAGNLKLTLPGKASDYNMSAQVGLGKITIDGEDWASGAASEYPPADGKALLALNCDLGAIEVWFEN